MMSPVANWVTMQRLSTGVRRPLRTRLRATLLLCSSLLIGSWALFPTTIGTMTIANYEWSEEYLDPSSNKYKTLQKNVLDTINIAYANVWYYKSVIIKGFSRGSVVCKFAIEFYKKFQNGINEAKADIESKLQSAKEDGNLKVAIISVDIGNLFNFVSTHLCSTPCGRFFLHVS